MSPFTLILIALGVTYVIGCFLVELEFFGWATLVLIATVVGVQSLHVFDILSYVAANALTSALYAVGYVVVGVVWSFVKWFSYLRKFRDHFRELKQKFLERKSLTGPDIDEPLLSEFKDSLRHQYEYRDVQSGQKPTAAENKARITAWMAFWPCSMVSTLLNDPIRRLFKFLFSLLKGTFQKLSDYVFRNDPELK